ncbi:SphA family protein [Tropicimonas aquimaris]|uniref:Transporter n=1 Tax=Tropicimonas aquimaris TaxID=914152 RepID=A0ABW3IQ12_9RHOB
MKIGNSPLRTALLGTALAGFAAPALAVEGGIGAYFLGTRDTLAGIVPPPGTYLSFTYDRLEGNVEGLSAGGLPIRADTDLTLDLLRVGITQSFAAPLWGGTPALNLTVPFLNPELTWTAVTPPLDGAAIDDSTSGIGDLSVTGLVGWHSDKLHYSTGLTVYAPTGNYDTATVNLKERTVDALSNGKNVWTFQPFVAATWLDTSTGFEASGAMSFLFSTENSATDYQTAPALQLEGAVVQRIRSGWGFGVTGYFYQQLDDDSGKGADQTRAALGAESLQARVAGAGLIVTYSGGTMFGAEMSLKAKYVTEFAAKRRFESDTFILNIAFAL